MTQVHGTFTSVNQMGRPGTNVFRQGADTNTTPPAYQQERFASQYVAMFKAFGYTELEATSLALEWLPDILLYDYTSAAGFSRNGRQLADDVVDNVVEIMTRIIWQNFHTWEYPMIFRIRALGAQMAG
jgi:hypothetical protein